METTGDDLFDGGVRGRLDGLTTELTERLFRQLSTTRELKGERCPGETRCAEVGPLRKYAGQPVDVVCGGCKLQHTKPEASPLNHAQNTALELEEMRIAGAVFLYTPTAYEWACLKALQRARAQDEEKEAKKREAKEAREKAKR